MRLRNRVVVTAGSVDGIGRTIASPTSQERASVVVNARPDNECAHYAASDPPAGSAAFARMCDTFDLSLDEGLITAAVKAFGSLDILADNAGVQTQEPFLGATCETWAVISSIKLRVFFLIQIAARYMARQKSRRILNISSVQDSVSLSNSSVHSTKGGMQMSGRTLAFELAQCNINLNAISRGAIYTNTDSLADSANRKHRLQNIPLGRIEETDAAIFLVSPKSNYITGMTLNVNGGMLVR